MSARQSSFSVSGRKARGGGFPSSRVQHESVCHAQPEENEDRMHTQYVAERGSGSNGTAYNEKDHEVLDLSRPPSRRVVCRATGSDARLIATALNASAGR